MYPPIMKSRKQNTFLHLGQDPDRWFLHSPNHFIQMNKYFFISFLLILGSIVHDLNAQDVGIGILAPTSRLDIRGDAASTQSILNAQTTYVGPTNVIAINGFSTPQSGYGIGGSFTGGGTGAQGTVNSTASGNGIGLFGSAAGAGGNRIGVWGNGSGGIANYGVYGSASGGAGYYAIYGSNPNTAGYAGYFNGRGYFEEELRANKNLIVDLNAGIGTLTPTTKLNIIGGADASLSTNGFIQLGSTNSWNLLFDDNEILARNNGAGNDLFIQNDGGNVLMCSSELGGVGIGLIAGTSLANGYIFCVDGKIIAEEMRIQNSTNWPDYVFENKYNLMPLDELKASIEVNKHLPNIPSAAEVENNGILVGDMQKKMMEKIEELTLYILDLNAANKKLQQDVDLLKAKMSQQ